MCEPINADLNASANDAILEGVDPISIDLGHLHTHVQSVSYELQNRQAQARRLLCGRQASEACLWTSPRWKG